MKYTFLLLFFSVTGIYTQAQYQVKQNFIYKNTAFDVFIIKADSSLKGDFKIMTNPDLINEASYFNFMGRDGDYFAITACIIDSPCTPKGLYISDGKEINPINLATNGKGNFFIPPNGVLYFTGNTFSITPSTGYSATNPLYAIQTGPILVAGGNINTELKKGSVNKNTRCGVGLFTKDGADYLVFIKSRQPVNFYDFAWLFMQKFSCRYALNLESASNCSLHLPGAADAGRSSVTVCNYIYIKLPQ